MVTLHLAYTAPINPPSTTPVLTHAQVWAGLQRKIRFAQEFVPVIASCSVLSEEDGVVTRDVVFKPGVAPKEKAREVVRGFGTSWVRVKFLNGEGGYRLNVFEQVDFEQEDGSVVKNIISDGADGALYMTYAFEFRFPDLREGSAEAEAQREKLKGVSGMILEVGGGLGWNEMLTCDCRRVRWRWRRALRRFGRWCWMGGLRSRIWENGGRDDNVDGWQTFMTCPLST
jgi:hypothetical protein